MISMLTHIVLCCVVLAISGQALKLPSYIKPCFRNRPDFSECALKNAAEAVAGLTAGDRKYRIPEFEPMVVDEIVIGGNPGPIDIAIIMQEFLAYGLADAVVKHVDVDFDKQVLSLDILYPRMEMISNYNLTGKLYFLKISDTGKTNMTFLNYLNKNMISYTLTTKPDGKEYMVLSDINSTVESDRVFFNFDNKFTKNRKQGDRLDKLIEENLEGLVETFGPTIGHGMGIITKAIIKYMFENIPYYETFPEEERSS